MITHEPAPPVAAQPSANDFFGKQRAGCLSPPPVGEFLAAAEKIVCAREAEGQAAGHVSFGTFLCAKEKYTDKE